MSRTEPNAAEVHDLMKFVGKVLREHRNDGYPGDVDGGELQDMAEACGLIRPVIRTKPCNDDGDVDLCPCADVGDFPLTCYIDTPLLRMCYRVSDAAFSALPPGGR